MHEALALYAGESLTTRVFVRARNLLAPLTAVERLVPETGQVLDVGCGHGLFTNLLALRRLEREVHGIDPSPAKINVAARVGAPLPNVRYSLGYVQDLKSESRYDAITILDVLYLVPPAIKVEIVRHCYLLLKPGGTLVLKTNDTWPRWKYWITLSQERLMTAAGLTFTQDGLHFWSRRQYWGLLRAAGFDVRFIELGSRLPYPHVAFVAKKGEHV